MSAKDKQEQAEKAAIDILIECKSEVNLRADQIGNVKCMLMIAYIRGCADAAEEITSKFTEGLKS